MLEILGKALRSTCARCSGPAPNWTCPTAAKTGAAASATPTRRNLALNPNAMVPVLRDGELVLWESNSIIRYLANRYAGERLYPQQAAPRARVDQWLDWQASDLNRSWSYAFMSLVRQSPAHRDAAQVEASLRGWTGFMEILRDNCYAPAPMSPARPSAWPTSPSACRSTAGTETPFEHPSLPAVRAWLRAPGARPGFLAHGRNGVTLIEARDHWSSALFRRCARAVVLAPAVSSSRCRRTFPPGRCGIAGRPRPPAGRPAR